MSLPLLVRPLDASEKNLVLAAWKKWLNTERFRTEWGRGLDGRSFWLLVNHVIDRITLPSSSVFVGCTETEPKTPLCWLVAREAKVLYVDARHEVLKDRVLSAALERELRARTQFMGPVTFNPFQELSR